MGRSAHGESVDVVVILLVADDDGIKLIGKVLSFGVDLNKGGEDLVYFLIVFGFVFVGGVF